MNFALVLGILTWDMLDCSGCNFLYLVKVGFDLESLSMCMYACLFIVFNFLILGEAKILIWH